MNQGLIPRRYAKALFLVATEKQCAAEVYEAMLRLCAAFDAEPALSRTMGNPAVAETDKFDLVATAAQAVGNAKALIDDFVKLLEKNHRIDLMREIALAYVAEYRRAKEIYNVVISAPQALESEELQRIQALVKKHLPATATAEFSQQINPDLIGGFTVAIDNELLDASVASELKQLRLKLLSL